MNEELLYQEVLMFLGCGIMNGRLHDYDRKSYVIYNGNYIVTNQSIIVHKRDVRLDILRNSKLAEYMLSIMIDKESAENGLYVTAISSSDNPESVPPCIGKAVSLITNNGNITTSYYYNYCLACIEAIYQLAQVPDYHKLHSLDYTKEQLLALYAEREKGRRR